MGEYYYPMLPKGELQQFDEYYTLERSHAFLVKNDWLSVYSNYSPNFKKPPLIVKLSMSMFLRVYKAKNKGK